MERCSKPLRCYVSPTATSGDTKIESVWCGVCGRNSSWLRSPNKSTFQVMSGHLTSATRFYCSNSSSIGKGVQAWLAHRVPVRLSNSSSIVNEQSSCACKVGNLSDGALLRTASLTSWILCWQSFRARCLDGFIDIGRFNFRFSTSSSPSPFYLQAAESAFVTCCESMWRTKGSPCPFRIEMTRTGERRKKEDMMVASQAEDPKLYVAHSRSQQHRLKI